MEPCIIIDDEPKARALLEAIIKDYCPQLQLMALCEDLPSGVKAIKKYQPSLVFLDIEMPGHSGLELLDFFNEEEVNFNVIFTTAYDEYAIRAFRFSAIDYLLKPIQHTQLVEAVDRFFKDRINFGRYRSETCAKTSITPPIGKTNALPFQVGNPFIFSNLPTLF